MGDFFQIIAAGPFFFVSSWVLMIFAGITGSDIGVRPFGYVTSMVVTIGLWLTLARAAGAIARHRQEEELTGRASACPGLPRQHQTLLSDPSQADGQS
jgi:hypothetical protein